MNKSSMIVSLLLFACWTTINHAFSTPPTPQRRVSLTTANAIVPLLSSTMSKRQRRKIRERICELEDEDFLMMDLKPKVLVHERDYFRQATRIQAWDEYVLVSVLCTSISFGALQDFAVNPDHEGLFFYEFFVKSLIQLTAGLACLSGLYSTMVFSLCILYGKTALGLEKDAQYDAFLDNTGEIRIAGFRAFSGALAFFAILVLLVLSEKLPLVMHIPAGSILIGAVYVGIRDWKILVDNAGQIFSPDDYVTLD